LGAKLPVQRKVFRIEENARSSAPSALSAREAEDAMRHHEYMSELRALRALIEPRATSRDTMERARAQLAEAQAYKHELEVIYSAVKRTRTEIGEANGHALNGAQVGRVGRELEAIVAGTEQATQDILKAAEDIERAANMLSAALKNEHEQDMAYDILDRVVQIFESCNFQDLTGQRVSKVLSTLQFIEQHVGRLMEIWQAVEQFEPLVTDQPGDGDRRFLNGPKLANEPGHSSQDEVDEIFGRAS
jgi:chemotaxis protein CheZ